jgi:hypothetical protein
MLIRDVVSKVKVCEMYCVNCSMGAMLRQL